MSRSLKDLTPVTTETTKRWVKNSYCPHCGSNNRGIAEHLFQEKASEPFHNHKVVLRCGSCNNTYTQEQTIEFYVDTSFVRPDPVECATCVHNTGETLFPWADGACKDLPFWLMGEPATDCLAPYVGELNCLMFEDVNEGV